MAKIRKNFRSLTFLERQQFVQAIEIIKTKIIPATGRSIYDEFVIVHSNATLNADTTDTTGSRNSAHAGPAFNPWHRFYLYRFEQELQKVISDITIPYWDWTQDVNDPANSPIWANDFMGGNGDPQDNYIVKTGPFAVNKWTTINADGSVKGGLQRHFGQFVSGLPTSAEVATALQEVPYDSPSWNTDSSPSHRNRLEGFIVGETELVFELHNKAHGWIGGDMSSTTISPNDPVFFLHHCNVDRLWAIWQDNNPNQGYVPVSQGPTGHNLQDYMYPWDGRATSLKARPIDVLDYRKLGYVYA